ncbi:MAG TPA: acyl-CoA dehydrogenase family protein [Acidimicrobiales bacterium]|jgi:alkylation response protein AidB-like acyl-CoA dehydrogenase
MTVTQEPSAASRGAAPDWLDELRGWIEDNWDPDSTVGEWWERLGHAGWSAPLLPKESYGRSMNRADAMTAARFIADAGALGAPMGMGISLVAPTIVTHGSREQIDRYLPDIVAGRKGWCQLFSEPGAGSDLAGLATRAVKDGDQWIVNGQKVWTSGGHWADLGMLLARTNPTAPKHQGISWFALDMHQPGVEIRTLREMTGGAMFCEVFFTDAVVSDDARIGDVNNGWQVANTTLFHERSGMGAGGDRGQRVGMARAGTVANDLGKRAGDFVKPRNTQRANEEPAAPSSASSVYIDLARTLGKDRDRAVRQRLAQSYILGEVQRLNTQRHKAVRAAGGDIPGLPNFSKLLTAHILRHNRDLGLELLGARGMLHGYDDDQRDTLADAPGGRVAHLLTAQALSAQALPIFGGTDQIQRNIIGERVLGLPKEPGDLSRLPFNELPRNG